MFDQRLDRFDRRELKNHTKSLFFMYYVLWVYGIPSKLKFIFRSTLSYDRENSIKIK